MLALDLHLHLYLVMADGFAVVVLCVGAGGAQEPTEFGLQMCEEQPTASDIAQVRSKR